ncbi:unnamed protein product [Coregonus sp. 'balchen']|nr:unnamed protein product [Coregonus sp. 'balchen']
MTHEVVVMNSSGPVLELVTERSCLKTKRGLLHIKDSHVTSCHSGFLWPKVVERQTSEPTWREGVTLSEAWAQERERESEKRELGCRQQMVGVEVVEVFGVERTVRDDKPVFEKMPLVWEEDMQINSKFLDRKKLKAKHNTYLRQHLELCAIMGYVLQFLLLQNPSNLFMFASEYFPHRPPGATFNTFSP